MAQHPELMFTHKDELVGLGPDVEIADTLQYGGWSLSITRAAHDFYGFLPLTPPAAGDSSGPALPDGPMPFRTDFYLLTPGQYEFPVPDSVIGIHPDTGINLVEPGAATRTEYHKGGVAIGVTLDGNVAGMVPGVQEQVGMLDDEERERLGAWLAWADIDLSDESLGQYLRQLQVHSLRQVLGQAATNSGASYLRMQNEKRANGAFLKQLLMFGVLFVGVGAWDMLDPELLPTAGLVSLGLTAGITLNALVRWQSQLREQQNAVAVQRAEEVGEVVFNAVHTTFCANVFNEETERRLRGGGE
jgi:hypothetical protein